MQYVSVTIMHFVYAIVSAWARAKSWACIAVIDSTNEVIRCGWLDTNDELYSSPCPSVIENPEHFKSYLPGLRLRCERKCRRKTKILQVIYLQEHHSCCTELSVVRGMPIMFHYACGKYNLNMYDKITRERVDC
ncbi:hypothetical protein D915_001481 [Fasciola hepatica]|uniref:Secreted protein n=1 Tax=Fasciola hepatica TaxID=6192 RepID=A0A4E0S3J6_FASHE|nr:hypothetical protein D915_001481 [Fasciola hepatica]